MWLKIKEHKLFNNDEPMGFLVIRKAEVGIFIRKQYKGFLTPSRKAHLRRVVRDLFDTTRTEISWY